MKYGSYKNDFEKLLGQAEQYEYQSSCFVGKWSFEPSAPGSFEIIHNEDVVVACENNEIIDAKWGSRVAGVEVCDILKVLIQSVPQIHLDAMIVRTDDCLDALGYEGYSTQISDVPGLEDIDYYRAWVTSKPNTLNPEKTDYVVYWDQGNTWCEVLAVFEGKTHEEFIADIHNKYHEWIQEEEALEQSSSIDTLIKQASARSEVSSTTSDLKINEPKLDF